MIFLRRFNVLMKSSSPRLQNELKLKLVVRLSSHFHVIRSFTVEISPLPSIFKLKLQNSFQMWIHFSYLKNDLYETNQQSTAPSG